MKARFLPLGTTQRYARNWKGVLGLGMLTIAILVALLSPHLILYDPVTYMADEEFVNHPPTWEYPLGTDCFGRDVYSQLIWGARSALLIAIPSALLVGVVGTIVGLVSGFYGGLVDAILQRISLTFLVWPSVPLVALIVFSWGPSHTLIGVIIGVTFSLWPTSARAIRAEVMSLKTRSYIEAACVSGASSSRIITHYILPNVMHLTFLYTTFAVASSLTLEATFNFLGLTSPSVITWGQMLSFTYHAASARFGLGGFFNWWTVLPPAFAIAGMVFSFYLISSGLRDAMNVQLIKF